MQRSPQVVTQLSSRFVGRALTHQANVRQSYEFIDPTLRRFGYTRYAPRAPAPQEQHGFIRIDTVYQGD